MKKFNILFISAIVILFIGCSTEMRIEGFNVTDEGINLLPGALIYSAYFNEYLFATNEDSNGNKSIISYNDEYQISGGYHLYRIEPDNLSSCNVYLSDGSLCIPTGGVFSGDVVYDNENRIIKNYLAYQNDGIGNIKFSLKYFVGYGEKGTYYNYGTELTDSVTLSFVKPTQGSIKSFELNGIGNGSVIKKSDLGYWVKNKFVASLKIEMNNSSYKYEIPAFSQTWSLKGIDASSDVGEYNLYAQYFDLTSDNFIKIYVLEY